MSDVEIPATRSLEVGEGEILLACPRRIVESLGRDRTPLGVEALAGCVVDAAKRDADLHAVLTAAGGAVRRSLGRERHETDLAVIAVRQRAV